MRANAKAFILGLLPGLMLGAWIGFGPKAHAESGASGTPTPLALVTTGDPIDKTTAVFRSGLSSADTATATGIKATTTFALNGRQNVTIAGRFTNSAATIGIEVWYLYNDGTTTTIQWPSGPYTLTASSVLENAVYNSRPLLLPGLGAKELRVIVTTAASAGTCDLWVGSF